MSSALQQALHQAVQPELPWLASAMLHAMTDMPAEPAALPGAQPRPAAQAAGALLGACCTCTEPAALCAMREALQSALQHHLHTAGRPLSMLQSGTGLPVQSQQLHCRCCSSLCSFRLLQSCMLNSFSGLTTSCCRALVGHLQDGL